MGSETDPPRDIDEGAVAPPRRYDPAVTDKAALARPQGPRTVDRVVAVTGVLAIAAFFLLGFLTGKWWIAWVVFLIPAAIKAWDKPDES